MPNLATCPTCGLRAPVPDEHADKTVRCPKCRTDFNARATMLGSATDTGGRARPAAEGPVPATLGRFRVRRLLGSGAFGAVYLAHDPRLGRDVAVKVLRPGLLAKPKYVERFLREAQAAAGLRHPNIVPVYETGRDGDRHFIVSAYIAGRPLADAIDEGGMEFRRAARIVRELADALAYAHDEGVVHRDVKPANILLDAKDRPYLTDFGLASRTGIAEKLTNAGAVLGTPAYMAPEQAKGQAGDPVPASDQYSLGVVLYELLTGRPPFAGRPDVVIYNQVHTEPDPPRALRPDVPAGLEAVCLRAMAKRCDERFASATDLAAALAPFAAGADATEPWASVGSHRSTGANRRRSAWPWWLAGLGLAVLFAGVSAGIAYRTQPPSGASVPARAIEAEHPPLDPPVPPAPVRVVSDNFDSGSPEGWTTRGLAKSNSGTVNFGVEREDGNGYLRATDIQDSQAWGWHAPAKYHGDHADKFGRCLAFRMRVTDSSSSASTDAFVTLSGQGISIALLVVDLGLPPTDRWGEYRLRLDTSRPWRVVERDFAKASDDDIRRVLADVTDIRIRSEFSTKRDTGYLDDVAFGVDD